MLEEVALLLNLFKAVTSGRVAALDARKIPHAAVARPLRRWRAAVPTERPVAVRWLRQRCVVGLVGQRRPAVVLPLPPPHAVALVAVRRLRRRSVVGLVGQRWPVVAR